MSRLLILVLLLGCEPASDMEHSDGAAPDGAAPDVAAPDMAVPDAAVAVPDAAVAVPDAAVAVPDAATPDAATQCQLIQAQSPDPIDWWGQGDAPSWRLPAPTEPSDCVLTTAVDAPWLHAVHANNTLFIDVDNTVPGGHQVGRVDLGGMTIEVTINAFRAPPDATKKVLIIGIDGLRADALQAVDTPQIDRLRAGGAWTFNASTQLTGATMSGPGWTSILTGVETEDHGVVNNGAWAAQNRDYPTILQRTHDLGLRTAAVVHWAPITDSLIEPEATDWRGALPDDPETVAAMAARLGEDYDVHFVHLDDVDHAGHSTGFDPQNPAYRAAITRIDAGVGIFLDAILARPTIDAESWLILFTTDHGGEGTSHGALNRVNRRIPLIIAGAAVDQPDLGDQPSHMDIYPTVMAFFGQPTDPTWGLDGSVKGLRFEAHCADQIDDDGDDLADCADPDCAPLCALACPDAEADLGQQLGIVAQVDTRDALDSGGSACGGQGAGEVAYTWTPPRAGRYAIHTVGADFDTVLYVLNEECLPLACNDHIYGSARNDVPIGQESGVFIDANPEQTLLLVVDGMDEGQTPLTIHEQAAACADATNLESAVGPRIAEGNNEAAPVRFEASCAGLGRDVVYRWQAPAAGRYRFDTNDSDFDTVLVLQNPTCDAELACNDDSDGLQSTVERDFDATEEITVIIGGFRGRVGSFVLNVTAL